MSSIANNTNICRSFLRDKVCLNEKCMYLHPTSSTNPNAGTPSSQQQLQPMNNAVSTLSNNNIKDNLTPVSSWDEAGTSSLGYNDQSNLYIKPNTSGAILNSNNMSTNTPTAILSSPPKKLCKFVNRCKNGMDCQFYHPKPGELGYFSNPQTPNHQMVDFQPPQPYYTTYQYNPYPMGIPQQALPIQYQYPSPNSANSPPPPHYYYSNPSSIPRGYIPPQPQHIHHQPYTPQQPHHLSPSHHHHNNGGNGSTTQHFHHQSTNPSQHQESITNKPNFISISPEELFQSSISSSGDSSLTSSSNSIGNAVPTLNEIETGLSQMAIQQQQLQQQQQQLQSHSIEKTNSSDSLHSNISTPSPPSTPETQPYLDPNFRSTKNYKPKSNNSSSFKLQKQTSPSQPTDQVDTNTEQQKQSSNYDSKKRRSLNGDGSQQSQSQYNSRRNSSNNRSQQRNKPLNEQIPTSTSTPTPIPIPTTTTTTTIESNEQPQLSSTTPTGAVKQSPHYNERKSSFKKTYDNSSPQVYPHQHGSNYQGQYTNTNGGFLNNTAGTHSNYKKRSSFPPKQPQNVITNSQTVVSTNIPTPPQ